MGKAALKIRWRFLAGVSAAYVLLESMPLEALTQLQVRAPTTRNENDKTLQTTTTKPKPKRFPVSRPHLLSFRMNIGVYTTKQNESIR
eukprot:COSAG06_NODE_541_length_14471_cov_35.139229_16_plen_88_part_00